ncbi:MULTISPECIES: DUF6301 family protein [unclassified Nocardia]|uniref:DUF6301 family protein n=1 Tax=unclassified Nocardia TaxID=2637762 RepID=UPI00278C3DBE|nr:MULTISPECIES: DUF6301 family protein [unclassified Nocardia]
MTEWRALSDTEIVELAIRLRSLEWSRKLEDAPEVVTGFGWKLNNTLPEGVFFDTGFGRSTGQMIGLDGSVHHISAQVTAYAAKDPKQGGQVIDAFARMTAALTRALGAPTARIPGDSPEIRWAGTETTLLLKALPPAVNLELLTNAALEQHDEAVRIEKQGLL